MSKNYISMKWDEFKLKFKTFLIHRKKIKALENFSFCHKKVNKGWVQLLKECLNCGFLEPKEEEFLDHMIAKTELQSDYLAWCHKTKWLKAHMQEIINGSLPKEEQMIINFAKLDKAPAGYLPRDMIAQYKQQQMRV